MRNQIQKKFDNPSRSSPKAHARACLCKDTNTYSRKCCDGNLWAQGIGNITRSPQMNGIAWENITTQWENITETYNE